MDVEEVLSLGSDFSCTGRVYGYYADPRADCQVFHICLGRRDVKWSFMCPNGTIFNQQHFVCDFALNVDCNVTEEFYNLNELFQYPVPEVNSTESNNVRDQASSLSDLKILPHHDTSLEAPTSNARGSNTRKSVSQLASITLRPNQLPVTAEEPRQATSVTDRIDNVKSTRLTSNKPTILAPLGSTVSLVINSLDRSRTTTLGTTQTP
ncbi:hypothetical protein TCAL_11009 [Tigriopus californicus]|uniref:Chitin-binding type-2 domain-containing protein n=1 Tax=Tigriopus californicus TaxID=6832 RepID=A0A553NUN2_TIGCA|nr:hypothetical protein TCAL_11009 [Tigriopus californicus]